MRVVFAIMSAKQSPETVAQLADSLAPHTVVIHHDFEKHPGFKVELPNVRFVPNPRPTGWGDWGFTSGILRTIDFCVNDVGLDYFQLLSPTCLPIRPLGEFVQHVAGDDCDVHSDLFEIERDNDTLVSFAFRAYVTRQSMMYRPVNRARSWYFGPEVVLEQFRSLSIRHPAPSYVGPLARLKSAAGLAVTRMAVAGWFSRHPFDANLRPYVGSTWVGMNQNACRQVLANASNRYVEEYFRHLAIVDELLFPTLLGNSGLRIKPGNHLVNTFSEKGNPAWFGIDDVDRILASDKYFARKFPDDVTAAVRAAVLRKVCAGRQVEPKAKQDA